MAASENFMRFGLSEVDLFRIQKVFKQFPDINKVLVFGSRAKGNFKPGSDLDLALEGENLTAKELLRISSQLDDLNLPFIFDLVDYHNIKNNDLTAHIQRVGKIIYKNA